MQGQDLVDNFCKILSRKVIVELLIFHKCAVHIKVAETVSIAKFCLEV